MKELVGLVACSKQKRGVPSITARQQYAGDLFRKAADYCEARYDRWFILSAGYGLVHPCEPIDPYDATIAQLTPGQRIVWGALVAHRLRNRFGVEDATYYLHAGEAYCEPVMHYLGDCRRPLEGLGIGQQKAWYAAQALQWQQSGDGRHGHRWRAEPEPGLVYAIREKVSRWTERGVRHFMRHFWLSINGEDVNAWTDWEGARRRADNDWGCRQRDALRRVRPAV